MTDPGRRVDRLTRDPCPHYSDLRAGDCKLCVCAAIQAAVAEEREACARIVDCAGAPDCECIRVDLSRRIRARQP